MHVPGSGSRTYHLQGVPFRSGSLVPGNENDARAYRDADIVGRLRAAGVDVADDGDVAIPGFLPHHVIPPVRSWPGPRIAWETVAESIRPHLETSNEIPLLVGCDCSVVVGTAQALARWGADDVYVLYVDGDFDDARPDASKCQSAAALALWLLTNGSPFCAGPPLDPSHVTVIGWTQPSASSETRMRSLSLDDVRRAGPAASARAALEHIPANARVVLHLDIDVFAHRALPAAYFPHEDGLSLDEGRELLRVLLQDPRVRVIEISEYAALRDGDHACVRALVDLLVASLPRHTSPE